MVEATVATASDMKSERGCDGGDTSGQSWPDPGCLPGGGFEREPDGKHAKELNEKHAEVLQAVFELREGLGVEDLVSRLRVAVRLDDLIALSKWLQPQRM